MIFPWPKCREFLMVIPWLLDDGNFIEKLMELIQTMASPWRFVVP